MKQPRRWVFLLLVPVILAVTIGLTAYRRHQRMIVQAATRGLLQEAAQPQPRLTVVKDLIAQGADVNAQDKDGWSPLHSASFAGATSLMQVLLDKGANPNGNAHPDSPTPLILVLQHNDPQGVKLLLSKGANPNLKRNIYDLGNITALKFLHIKSDTAEFDSQNIEVRKEKQIERLLLRAGAKIEDKP